MEQVRAVAALKKAVLIILCSFQTLSLGLDPICKRVGEAADTRIFHRWNQADILACIQALEGKVDLNTRAIMIDVSDRTAKILKKIIGIRITGAALFKAARRHFPGGWAEAVTTAGIDYYHDVKLRVEWTEHLVIDCILELHDKKRPLFSEWLYWDESQETTALLRPVVGKDTTGFRLHKAAARYFGNWPAALAAAGLDPKEHRIKGTWTKVQVIESIQLLQRKRVPLNPKSVVYDHTSRTRRLLKTIVGREVNGGGLYVAALVHLGGWKNALIAAGLNPAELLLLFPVRGRLSTVNHQKEDVYIEGNRRVRLYIGIPPESPERMLELEALYAALEQAVESLTSKRERRLAGQIVEEIIAMKENPTPSQIQRRIVEHTGESPTQDQITSVLRKLSMNGVLRSFDEDYEEVE